jgi:hypothetical protein
MALLNLMTVCAALHRMPPDRSALDASPGPQQPAARPSDPSLRLGRHHLEASAIPGTAATCTRDHARTLPVYCTHRPGAGIPPAPATVMVTAVITLACQRRPGPAFATRRCR